MAIRSERKNEPQMARLKIATAAFDQAVKAAERYGCTVEDILDDIVIEHLPIKPYAPTCGLCNQTGHRAKKCPNQLGFGLPL